MCKKPLLKLYLTTFAIFFAVNASADIVADQKALLKLFTESCLKTYPTYSGIDKIMSSKGFEQTSYGAWKGEHSFVNPAVKLSGGGLSCLVTRQKTDPRGIHTALIEALRNASGKDVKATIRGRKTEITLTIRGAPTRITAGPLARGVADMAIFKDQRM